MTNTDKVTAQKTKADFSFKQFSICHDKCAMKVSTDGILLGAWSQINEQSNIADIGTGSGLIALMLAQRTNDESQNIDISAIEIDIDAADQAGLNFKQSPWHQRLKVHQQDINQFATSPTNQNRYSTIVSNPPYFSEALLGKSKQRNLARHNNQLPFSQLLKSTELLATSNAVFNVILPTKEACELLEICEQFGWYLNKCTKVSSVEGKVASRFLMAFSKHKILSTKDTVHKAENMFIRDKDNNYSSDYRLLCENFYLKF